MLIQIEPLHHRCGSSALHLSESILPLSTEATARITFGAAIDRFCNQRYYSATKTILSPLLAVMAAQLAGALRPPAQLAGALRPPRIELFFKTPAELKERLRDLTGAGYRAFNLVNKDKKDPMLACPRKN